MTNFNGIAHVKTAGGIQNFKIEKNYVTDSSGEFVGRINGNIFTDANGNKIDLNRENLDNLGIDFKDVKMEIDHDMPNVSYQPSEPEPWIKTPTPLNAGKVPVTPLPPSRYDEISNNIKNNIDPYNGNGDKPAIGLASLTGKLPTPVVPKSVIDNLMDKIANGTPEERKQAEAELAFITGNLPAPNPFS